MHAYIYIYTLTLTDINTIARALSTIVEQIRLAIIMVK